MESFMASRPTRKGYLERSLVWRKRRRLATRWLNVTAPAVAMLFVIAGAAEAQPQQNTTRMSCAAARQLVTRQGAIVLRTSPSTYDRYVSTRAYCMSTEITEPAFVPTADDRQCFVGYTCREPINDLFP
jgi:hypothetical protein